MQLRSWHTAGPFDLRQTLRFVLPTSGPALVRNGNHTTFAVSTIDGDATITLSHQQNSVVGEAVGPGSAAALNQVPRLVGLDDDFHGFALATGPVRELDRRNRGLRLGSTGRVFDAALPIIIGQRVTTDEAKKSYRQIVLVYGASAPGNSGLTVSPQAEVIADLSYEDLHRFGVERNRAQILIEVARRASRLEEILTMSREDAMRRLAAVRGIGPWTVAQVMGVAWGDRDAIPHGDFHLPNTVSWLLAGEPRGSDERMDELLEPFRPQRRRALLLIKSSGVHAPRYGPRSAKGTIGQSS